MSEEYILSMEGISKHFGNVAALDKVDFRVKKGEIHALLGENGAGKSTLMKILNGVHQIDEGHIYLRGKEVVINNRQDAFENGIGLVFQELNLVPSLTALENAFLGHLEINSIGGVKWKNMRKRFVDFTESIGLSMNPDTPVSELSIAQKQMVEISRVLMLDSEILVLDEPTATLTSDEINRLFDIMEGLKAKGITIIYISHRLDEVFRICDRLTVLRDGKHICTMDVKDTTRPMLIEKMVGRPMSAEFPPRDHQPGEVMLEADKLFTKDFLKDISFNVRKGEILGVAGLLGSGRTEVARALFGADKLESGTIRINGKIVKISSVTDGKRNSIALVPEDRKEQGLSTAFSISKNITITDLKKISSGIIINHKKEEEKSLELVKELNIKIGSLGQKVGELSGGNMQKVVLAKWLFDEADILILDEPTRGIDVGAKLEIYNIMNNLVSQGKSVIMISSELPEILAMSDRIIVMYEGKLKAFIDNHEGLNAEDVMGFAIG